MLASARLAVTKSYSLSIFLFKIHNFLFGGAGKIFAKTFVFCPRLWYNLSNT